jgi:hypothetical protein
MQTPLKIAFHNLPSSEGIEREMRRRAVKLEKRYARLVGCRVSVEALHHQHRTGNVYEVHIDLRLPGGDVAVRREPHRAKEKYAHPDLKRSLRDAFAAAERRLEDFKEQQAGKIKSHDADFATLKRGDAVHYIAVDGDTGPIARKVWLGPDYHLD